MSKVLFLFTLPLADKLSLHIGYILHSYSCYGSLEDEKVKLLQIQVINLIEEKENGSINTVAPSLFVPMVTFEILWENFMHQTINLAHLCIFFLEKPSCGHKKCKTFSVIKNHIKRHAFASKITVTQVGR